MTQPLTAQSIEEVTRTAVDELAAARHRRPARSVAGGLPGPQGALDPAAPRPLRPHLGGAAHLGGPGQRGEALPGSPPGAQSRGDRRGQVGPGLPRRAGRHPPGPAGRHGTPASHDPDRTGDMRRLRGHGVQRGGGSRGGVGTVQLRNAEHPPRPPGPGYVEHPLDRLPE